MAGVAAPDLLCRAVHALTERLRPPEGDETVVAFAPQWLQVDEPGQQVFVGWGTGIWTLGRCDGSAMSVTSCTGKVPGPSDPVGGVGLAAAAASWIAADVNGDPSEQRRMLHPDAICFGHTGSEAIISGNMELSARIRFRMPHPIVLSHCTSTVSWDFDIQDKGTELITGRGTDVVHFSPAPARVVTRVDTLRHLPSQPDWVVSQAKARHTRI